MVAKPIIDIDIAVSLDDITAAVTALGSHGYTYHKEKGDLGRYAFRYNGHVPDAEGSAEIRRNVYICEPDSLSLRNHLVVKETLMPDAELREEYSRVKVELAEGEYASLGEYVDGKNVILAKILSRGGLTKDELEGVERANVRQASASEPVRWSRSKRRILLELASQPETTRRMFGNR